MRKNINWIFLMMGMLPVLLGAQSIYTKSKTYAVLNAEVSTHYPGIQGAPILKTYAISIVLKKDVKNLPDSIFADGFADKIEWNIPQGKQGFKKGEKINGLAQIRISTADTPQFGEAFSVRSGIAGNGICLIRYKCEKKKGNPKVYLKISSLKKGAEVFAP